MTEYINKAELLRETICEGILCSECSFNDDVKGAGCELIRYINELPTIDIVHCKDCKYCKIEDWYEDNFRVCKRDQPVRRSSWFCSDGEREERR